MSDNNKPNSKSNNNVVDDYNRIVPIELLEYENYNNVNNIDNYKHRNILSDINIEDTVNVNTASNTLKTSSNDNIIETDSGNDNSYSKKNIESKDYDIPVESDIAISGKAIVPKEYKEPPKRMSNSEFLSNIIASGKNIGPSLTPEQIISNHISLNDLQDGELSFNQVELRYYSFFNRFASSLYNVWHYPENSAKRGESGVVRVSFKIMKDGSITNIHLNESSGYPDLDREVLKALRTMKNVPLPGNYNKDSITIHGYFVYLLDGGYRLY